MFRAQRARGSKNRSARERLAWTEGYDAAITALEGKAESREMAVPEEAWQRGYETAMRSVKDVSGDAELLRKRLANMRKMHAARISNSSV
jgi:hypothetical protein